MPRSWNGDRGHFEERNRIVSFRLTDDSCGFKKKMNSCKQSISELPVTQCRFSHVFLKKHGESLGVCLLLSVHLFLVGWLICHTSPNGNEAGHMVGGIQIWEHNQYDIYRVNPPLTRMIAAIPSFFTGLRVDWTHYSNMPGDKPEEQMGIDLFSANSVSDLLWSFFAGRLILVPLTVIGGIICYFWAKELYGIKSGFVALTLWCFSPDILTWAATIIPDVSATVMGLIALFCYYHWLKQPSWKNAILASIFLGLTLLTKFTWIISFILWPLMLVFWLLTSSNSRSTISTNLQYFGGLSCILIGGMTLVNCGYLFQGSLCQLKNFEFVSKTLSQDANWVYPNMSGSNCFSTSCLGSIYIPFPKDFILGIDIQKRDFERGLPSYLCGLWANHGWWYYYIIGVLVKTPLGTLGLGVLSLYLSICSVIGKNSQYQMPPSCWRGETILLFPAVAIFTFVSVHSGFSMHYRYILPVFPFFFIWVSKSVSGFLGMKRFLTVAFFLVWSVSSSLSCYPYTMSFFNEAAGGPSNGYKYFLGSGLDWGQNAIYFHHWVQRNRHLSPLYICDSGLNLPLLYKMEAEDGQSSYATSSSYYVKNQTPQVGWHAIGVNQLFGEHPEKYHYFLDKKPESVIANGIWVYKVEENECK